MQGEALSSDGSWVKLRFLVDTGADRTVFSAPVLELLQLKAIDSAERLSGAGGVVDSVIVATEIRFSHDQSGKATFQGQYAACGQTETSDMSVLGRDILNLFALIVDRPGDTIFLVGPHHTYSIHQR
jgi:predicted aspartyl protease